MINKKRVAAIALAVTTPLFCLTGSASQRLEEALAGVTAPESQTAEAITDTSTTEESETSEQIVWEGKNFTHNETEVLNFFQEQGITDKAALATLLGNVKQESKFTPDICEGGHRTTYYGCRSGGYGLIQWTTSDRYYGLGRHSQKIGGNPSTLPTQLSYLITERQWKVIQHRMRQPGQSIGYYMNAAYSWLGWGVHGARTHYSHQYYNSLVPTK